MTSYSPGPLHAEGTRWALLPYRGDRRRWDRQALQGQRRVRALARSAGLGSQSATEGWVLDYVAQLREVRRFGWILWRPGASPDDSFSGAGPSEIGVIDPSVGRMGRRVLRAWWCPAPRVSRHVGYGVGWFEVSYRTLGWLAVTVVAVGFVCFSVLPALYSLVSTLVVTAGVVVGVPAAFRRFTWRRVRRVQAGTPYAGVVSHLVALQDEIACAREVLARQGTQGSAASRAVVHVDHRALWRAVGLADQAVVGDKEAARALAACGEAYERVAVATRKAVTKATTRSWGSDVEAAQR